MVTDICRHCGEPIYRVVGYWYHTGLGFLRCEAHARSRYGISTINPDLMAYPLKEEDIVDRILTKYKHHLVGGRTL